MMPAPAGEPFPGLGGERWTILHGECLATLQGMSRASVDAIVTDPPAGIAFMNASWDADKGGRDAWIAWLAAIFLELRRVVKPGGHALVWSLPRTAHWTATAIENAGWSIRDRVTHLFASGFPKSMNVAKAIDRAAGATREIVGPSRHNVAARHKNGEPDHDHDHGRYDVVVHAPVTASATDAARQWDGWGTALKPAVEDWWLCRAPLGERTIAANVIAHGTGALNIDATRIAHGADVDLAEKQRQQRGGGAVSFGARGLIGTEIDMYSPLGRWPAHLVLSHADGCVQTGTRKIRGSNHAGGGGGIFATGDGVPVSPGHADADGLEEIESWDCTDACPVRMLDEQSGDRPSSPYPEHVAEGQTLAFSRRAAGGYSDSGGASRFFFTAKPATSEREKGIGWMPSRKVNDGRAGGGAGNDNPRLRGESDRRNSHPTVKSVALMRWLCRMITPPGGIVLDPFAGSGTTIVAALADQFRAIGIEQDAQFAALARARVEGDMPLLNRLIKKE